MTVRQCFSKAFGEVPEGATCHDAYGDIGRTYTYACYKVNDRVYEVDRRRDITTWTPGHSCLYTKRPDISERDAIAYRGFFGAEYDAICEEHQTIQFSGEVTGLRAVGDKTIVEVLVDEPSEVVMTFKGKRFESREVCS